MDTLLLSLPSVDAVCSRCSRGVCALCAGMSCMLCVCVRGKGPSRLSVLYGPKLKAWCCADADGLRDGGEGRKWTLHFLHLLGTPLRDQGRSS